MEKIALVLSGGGAQGAYEIGAWKALRKMHYKFDIVTGTSVGALNAIMVVQKDFNKAYKTWRNISYNDIYEEQIDNNIKLNALYKKYAKEIIKNKGMAPKMLENLLSKVYDEKKFYKSNIDYGMVTFNLSTMKPKMLKKKDIPPKKLVDYAIASASCFPAFKIKEIDNEKYIDGGYYDNLPINLALKMGADKIIAIDLQAVGIKKKLIKKTADITIIKPQNRLMNMLDFNTEKIREAIKFGYNDTMKKYQKLDGNKFTFKKGHLENNYLKYYSKFNSQLENLKLYKATKLGDFIFKKYKELFLKAKINMSQFNNIVEECGKSFNLKESKIYSIKKYNKILQEQLAKTNALKRINLQDYKIKNIFDKKRIIKTIYEALTQKKKKDFDIYINLYPKELLEAIYLKSINN